LKVGLKIRTAARLNEGVTLTPIEAAVMDRALETLRRVAKNGCTNPQREAVTALWQVD
jgi:hypothetical protein